MQGLNQDGLHTFLSFSPDRREENRSIAAPYLQAFQETSWYPYVRLQKAEPGDHLPCFQKGPTSMGFRGEKAMNLFSKNIKTPSEKEWEALLKREERYLKRQEEEKPSFLKDKLETAVPEKLKEGLKLAFYKAFQTVFVKGAVVIEKTYNKDKKEFDYKMNVYAAELKENRKNVRAFLKQAEASRNKNLLLSGLEGLGLGFFGIGIPDIPLFTAVVLKGIYEIAASFGYGYETREEQEFILKLIQVSLSRKDSLRKGDQQLNQWIEGETGGLEEREVLLKAASSCLAEELLVLKFVQGIPLVGIVGGLSDSIYLKRISDYGLLKYQRRFLTDRKRNR